MQEINFDKLKTEPTIKQIYSLVELLEALSNLQPATRIANIHCLPLFNYTSFGFHITGADSEKCILSFSNSDGIGLTAKHSAQLKRFL